jgi:cytoskeleton protein RodZ
MSGQIVPLSVNSDTASLGPETTEARQAAAESLMPLSVGQQLRAARTGRGLSAADVAKTLKLSPHQVEALEADDWSRLPCNTIIRGFVRNYARLVGLNSDPLMARLDRLQMPRTPELEMPVGTNVRVPQEGGVERRDYLRVFSGLSVLCLAVLAYFFFPPELWQQAVSTLKAMTLSREATVTKVVPAPVPAKAPDAEVARPATTVTANEPATTVQSMPVATSPAMPAANMSVSPPATVPANASVNMLKFAFTQPSWVEVRDRSGEIIFSQLSQAGGQREIEGRPPFALVIGNASHVTLQYKGKPVDLSRRSKDDVARITVE